MWQANIKQKLLGILLLSVLLSIGVVWLIFSALMTSYHAHESRVNIQNEFTDLESHLQRIRHQMEAEGKALAMQKDIVASISMVENYQDIKHYQPLIFDVEKKNLLLELSEVARAADMDILAAYTRSGQPISFVYPDGGIKHAGYVTYKDSIPHVYLRSTKVKAGFSRSPLPTLVQTRLPDTFSDRQVFRQTPYADGLVLEVLTPVIRKYPSGANRRMGMIRTAKLIDKDFLEQLATIHARVLIKTGLGNLHGKTDGLDLESLFHTEAAGRNKLQNKIAWIDQKKHFIGVISFPELTGPDTLFYLALNKAELIRDLNSMKNAAVVGLLLAGLLIGALGIFLVNRMITNPIARLEVGVEGLTHGKFDFLTGFKQHDELGRLANSFNAMAETITNREAELKEHREHLQELVEERTRDLEDAQEELIRKERLATLGQLTGTVSHELRNPLASMRPSVYILQKKADPKDEHIQSALERINRSIARCDHIIDELLDFTRITRLKPVAVPLDSWLEDEIRHMNLPEDISVNWKPGCDGLEASFDPDRMHRVLINVIDNAHHAMQSDEAGNIIPDAELTVSSQQNGDQVSIQIDDNGCGIPEEIQDKLFIPLYSTKGFGVGLGMPTVKQIMEQHQGGVEISSQPGEGTSITLWFPVNLSAKAPQQATTDTVAQG